MQHLPEDLLPQQFPEQTPDAGALQKLHLHNMQQGNYKWVLVSILNFSTFQFMLGESFLFVDFTLVFTRLCYIPQLARFGCIWHGLL